MLFIPMPREPSRPGIRMMAGRSSSLYRSSTSGRSFASYLAARETEYTNLRILLMGRAAGIDPAVIRTRLRASYV